MKKILLSMSMALILPALSAQIQPYNGEFPLASCDFEACSWVVPGSGADSLWQFGEPQKLLFDSAYSVTNCWVTDTLNAYGDSRDDYFTVKLPVTQPNNLIFSFWHRYDTDSLADGGIVEVSLDNGVTYQDYLETFAPPLEGYASENMYEATDTLFDGRAGFSGNSGGWIYSRIQWIWVIPVKTTPDSIFIRFRFVSDTRGNAGDGWMIDDLDISFVDIPGAIVDPEARVSLALAPNPVQSSTRVTFEAKPGKQYRLYLHDLMGRRLFSDQVSEPGIYDLALESLPSGQYWLMLEENGKLVGRSTVRKD